MNKIYKALTKLTKKKREKTQMNKIRNESGKVTTHRIEMKRL